MPFQSEAQRRYLWARHPTIARRWAHEHPGQHDLPYHKKKKKEVKKAASLAAVAATIKRAAADRLSSSLAALAAVPFPGLLTGDASCRPCGFVAGTNTSGWVKRAFDLSPSAVDVNSGPAAPNAASGIRPPPPSP